MESTLTAFESILFDRDQTNFQRISEEKEEYSFIKDLNLNQIFKTMEQGREGYNLKPFFLIPLNKISSIAYRHETFRDLENQELLKSIETFAEGMRKMREDLAQVEKLSHEYQKASMFLEAVETYCDSVNRLAQELTFLELRGRAFLGFREYLSSYARSESFCSLFSKTKSIKHELGQITYCIQIKGNRVSVREFDGEPDYTAEVENVFTRFKQGAVKDYRITIHDYLDMNNVEGRILDRVVKLYPKIFAALHDYFEHYHDYADAIVTRFDREVQFYLAYLQLIKDLQSSGLKFCYPQISELSKEIHARETFDLSLASELLHRKSKTVVNDFYLEGKERIFVVSGPNQGGKTTFARTFGQLHYLAKLGFPVPGSETKLFLCDEIFTHFEKEEHIQNLRGKLQDELVRLYDILQKATDRSVVIINESFASTTLNDALFLGKEILNRIISKDILCVYVTFIDELSSFSDKTVSMVSTVVPENPAIRTFKIVRRPADGRAYAIAIAEKYGLTYETLKRRIAQQRRPF